MVIYRGKSACIRAVAKSFHTSMNEARKIYTIVYKTFRSDNKEEERDPYLRAQASETMMYMLAYNIEEAKRMIGAR